MEGKGKHVDHELSSQQNELVENYKYRNLTNCLYKIDS